MTRLESITVDIAGTSVYPTSLSITSGVGRGYNACTVSGLGLIGSVGDTMTIVANTQVFTFLIDQKNYGERNSISFTGYGKPIELTDVHTENDGYTYTSSDELISQSVGTIPVVNNIPTITFINQSYSKDSTPMSRILDMVRVIGGEAYEVNGTLYLDELKSIAAAPTIAHSFVSGEVFGQSYTDKRDKTAKLQSILTNPVTEDIYSEPVINFDYDDENMKGEVYFNPSLSKGFTYSVTGLNDRVPLQSVVNETISLSDVSYIQTKGGIDALLNITIDGTPLVLDTDYFLYLGYNVIRFAVKQTGEMVVSYNTKSVTVYAYTSSSFSITYQCNKIEDTIPDSSVDNVINSGNCYAEIIDPLVYEKGGNVLVSLDRDITLIFAERKGAPNLVDYKTQALTTGTGTLYIKYLYDTTDWTETAFMGNLTDALKTTIETTTDEIIYDSDLALYVVYLDKPITSVNAIYFGSQAITGYTYVNTGAVPYISFDAGDVGKKVDISMNIDLVDITIPAPQAGHPVTLLDAIVCNGAATQKWVLDDNALCSLPATFKIDVAGSFDLPIADVFGKEVTGDFGSLIVDNFGKVEVTVTTAGLYYILCSNIKENGKITVDAQGVV